MQQTKAVFIGKKTLEILDLPVDLSVLGNSSRGVFLESSNGWVMFLSREPFRGPVSINLTGDFHILERVQQGEPALVDENKLIFPRNGISISLSNAEVWNPPPPPDHPAADQPESIKSQLTSLTDPLLDAILDPIRLAGETLSRIEQRALGVSRELRSADSANVKEAALSLLGMGTGLTPEGDDFLIGMCFSLARLGAVECGSETGTDIVDQAYLRTTRLSANLIELAAIGQADERLVSAHDALYRGSPEAAEAVQTLLGWGATSGRMALAGIAAGLLSHSQL